MKPLKNYGKYRKILRAKHKESDSPCGSETAIFHVLRTQHKAAIKNEQNELTTPMKQRSTVGWLLESR